MPTKRDLIALVIGVSLGFVPASLMQRPWRASADADAAIVAATTAFCATIAVPAAQRPVSAEADRRRAATEPDGR
jgi:hypothetical protein